MPKRPKKQLDKNLSVNRQKPKAKPRRANGQRLHREQHVSHLNIVNNNDGETVSYVGTTPYDRIRSHIDGRELYSSREKSESIGLILSKIDSIVSRIKMQEILAYLSTHTQEAEEDRSSRQTPLSLVQLGDRIPRPSQELIIYSSLTKDSDKLISEDAKSDSVQTVLSFIPKDGSSPQSTETEPAIAPTSQVTNGRPLTQDRLNQLLGQDDHRPCIPRK